MLFRRKRKAIPPPPPTPVPKDYTIVERYALQEPFAYAIIAENPHTGEYKYILDEIQLDTFEQPVYRRILDILLAEIRSPIEEVSNPRSFFNEEAKKVVKKYRISLGWLPEISWSKILYYAERDLIGFGKIDALMRDPNIEDISCDGVNKPIYVWHRKYESLETNITFTDDEELDNFVVKLAHMGGRHVSSAFPIADVSLPGKHRLAVCYRREVTPFGTTFTIRKFREDPYSIIDLVNLGTISEEMAAYFWLCLENRASIMVVGGTAAGKTTALNALACLIKPGSKIISIEETPELNLSHRNWISLISRQSYGLGENQTGEISLFDLVKASMRHRPDYIIIGEVRGNEVYVLFQALATGHGGMCTMHAENLTAAIRRLTSKPMDIAPVYIPLMNIVITIQRVQLPKVDGRRTGRRMIAVSEIADYERYVDVFQWDAAVDGFTSMLDNSVMIRRLSKRLGVGEDQLMDDLRRRVSVLRWMRSRGIRSYQDVTAAIAEYYSRPREFYEKRVGVIAAK
jgi:flagellar protein FlaI